MISIPTFKVGDRVMVHEKLIEWVCPYCKLPYNVESDGLVSMEGTIFQFGVIGAHCNRCLRDLEVDMDGWYGVQLHDGRRKAYPYTFLTLLEPT